MVVSTIVKRNAVVAQNGESISSADRTKMPLLESLQTIMKTQLWIVDPPSGWRYGFPKPLTMPFEDVKDDEKFIAWLLANGYPQGAIDDGMHRHTRMWAKEFDVDDPDDSV